MCGFFSLSLFIHPSIHSFIHSVIYYDASYMKFQLLMLLFCTRCFALRSLFHIRLCASVSARQHIHTHEYIRLYRQKTKLDDEQQQQQTTTNEIANRKYTRKSKSLWRPLIEIFWFHFCKLTVQKPLTMWLYDGL